MNFRKRHGKEDPEINLIPFIDVLLVILIFLMVTTTFSRFTALQITLPTADAEKAQEQPLQINIGIDAQNRYTIDNQRVAVQNAEALATELTAVVQASGRKDDPIIAIAADATAAHQTVINVLDAARIAGYPRVVFVAQASAQQ